VYVEFGGRFHRRYFVVGGSWGIKL